MPRKAGYVTKPRKFQAPNNKSFTLLNNRPPSMTVSFIWFSLTTFAVPPIDYLTGQANLNDQIRNSKLQNRSRRSPHLGSDIWDFSIRSEHPTASICRSHALTQYCRSPPTSTNARRRILKTVVNRSFSAVNYNKKSV